MQMSAAITVHGRKTMLQGTALGVTHGAWLAPGLFHLCSMVSFLSDSLVLTYTFSEAHLITECFNNLQNTHHLPLYRIHLIYLFNCCDVYSTEKLMKSIS